MSAGMPICAEAWAIAAVAWLRDALGARLKEMVVATNVPWWLTTSGVVPGACPAKEASGTIASTAVLSAEPVETLPRPVLARAFVAWLMAVLVASAAAVLVAAVAVEVTVPATALVDSVPPTVPPAVLIHRLLRVSGLCQYSGATSITTWYWLSGL